ncbi:hypothetical protein EYZ11_011843 [Aspergillus tanneri]|uniref:Uncharacterized protein n=1 Tax=Aspergillus tanneri TaxID=1220188 RepID=A0A4S3J3V6_9EURO|nr:hypothetical protein EYZ11_011843 [Aspergillus tanneri]
MSSVGHKFCLIHISEGGRLIFEQGRFSYTGLAYY